MAYRRAMGWAVLLVALLAASAVMVQSEEAVDEQSLYEWTSAKIKEITDSASSTVSGAYENSKKTASGVYENGKKKAEALSNSAKEYSDHAKESFTRATSGAKEYSGQTKDSVTSGAKEYSDQAKDSLNKAASGAKEYSGLAKDSVTGKKEPSSKTLDLLEKSKQAAYEKYQATKDGSAESADAAKKQYETVSAKLSDLTTQVTEKIKGTAHEEL